MNDVLKVFGFCVVLLLSTVYSGYALTVMWDWFLLGKFTDLTLSIPEALGLSFVVKLIITDMSISRETLSLSKSIVLAFVTPTVFLCFGWITLQFI